MKVMWKGNFRFGSCLFDCNWYNKPVITCLFMILSITNRHSDLCVKLNAAYRFCVRLASAADSVLYQKLIFVIASVSVQPDSAESPRVLEGGGAYYSGAAGTAETGCIRLGCPLLRYWCDSLIKSRLSGRRNQDSFLWEWLLLYIDGSFQSSLFARNCLDYNIKFLSEFPHFHCIPNVVEIETLALRVDNLYIMVYCVRDFRINNLVYNCTASAFRICFFHKTYIHHSRNIVSCRSTCVSTWT